MAPWLTWLLALSCTLAAGHPEECCGSPVGTSRCEDNTFGTPCCGVGKCNVFCCNCDGGCRKADAPPSPAPPSESQLATPLNQWPMITSHDASTSYFEDSTCTVTHEINDWAMTQFKGTFANQLDCGSRAIDLRPFVDKDGNLMMHHGAIHIKTNFADAMKDVTGWANAHPGELVLLLHSHCDAEKPETVDSCNLKAVQAYKTAGIPLLACQDISKATLGSALEQGRLAGNGSVLAAVNCVDEEYDPSIKCYGDLVLEEGGSRDAAEVLRGQAAVGSVELAALEAAERPLSATKPRGDSFACYESDSDKAFTPLWNYMDKLCNTQSPPFAGVNRLWMAQAHWQYDTSSVAQGVLHGSCILKDESKSEVNLQLAQKIRNGDLKHINLLEVDYVCDHGLDIFDALRSRVVEGAAYV